MSNTAAAHQLTKEPFFQTLVLVLEVLLAATLIPWIAYVLVHQHLLYSVVTIALFTLVVVSMVGRWLGTNTGFLLLMSAFHPVVYVTALEQCTLAGHPLVTVMPIAMTSLYFMHLLGVRRWITGSIAVAHTLCVITFAALEVVGAQHALCLPAQYKMATHNILLEAGSGQVGWVVIGLLVLNMERVTQKQYKGLQEAYATNVETSEAKDRLLRVVSHELRTPLNAIFGYCDLLIQGADQRKVFSYAKIILGQGRCLLNKVNMMIDFAEMTAGAVNIVCSKIKSIEIMETALDLQYVEAMNKSINLLLRPAYDMPRYFWSDGQRILQVLSHILNNAIKFSPVGSDVELAWEPVTRVMGVEARSQPCIRVTVTDHGEGMDALTICHVKQPFGQAVVAESGNAGIGLGLNIANHLVRSLGGQLTVESEGLGHGTRVSFVAPVDVCDEPRPLACNPPVVFTLGEAAGPQHRAVAHQLLWLGCEEAAHPAGTADVAVVFLDDDDVPEPAAAAAASIVVTSMSQSTVAIGAFWDGHTSKAQVPLPVLPSKLLDAVTALRPAPAPGAGAEAAAKPSVLVVDDVAMNLMLMSKQLTRRGYAVATARDGQEAVDMSRAADPPYDVVLMDCNMPVKDGYEATRELRRLPQYAATPIFAHTANDGNTDRLMCFRSGMDMVFAKPINFQELDEQIRATLANPGAREKPGGPNPLETSVPRSPSAASSSSSMMATLLQGNRESIAMDIPALRVKSGGDDP